MRCSAVSASLSPASSLSLPAAQLIVPNSPLAPTPDRPPVTVIMASTRLQLPAVLSAQDFSVDKGFMTYLTACRILHCWRKNPLQLVLFDKHPASVPGAPFARPRTAPSRMPLTSNATARRAALDGYVYFYRASRRKILSKSDGASRPRAANAPTDDADTRPAELEKGMPLTRKITFGGAQKKSGDDGGVDYFEVVVDDSPPCVLRGKVTFGPRCMNIRRWGLMSSDPDMPDLIQVRNSRSRALEKPSLGPLPLPFCRNVRRSPTEVDVDVCLADRSPALPAFQPAQPHPQHAEHPSPIPMAVSSVPEASLSPATKFSLLPDHIDSKSATPSWSSPTMPDIQTPGFICQQQQQPRPAQQQSYLAGHQQQQQQWHWHLAPQQPATGWSVRGSMLPDTAHLMQPAYSMDAYAPQPILARSFGPHQHASAGQPPPTLATTPLPAPGIWLSPTYGPNVAALGDEPAPVWTVLGGARPMYEPATPELSDLPADGSRPTSRDWAAADSEADADLHGPRKRSAPTVLGSAAASDGRAGGRVGRRHSLPAASMPYLRHVAGVQPPRTPPPQPSLQQSASASMLTPTPASTWAVSLEDPLQQLSLQRPMHVSRSAFHRTPLAAVRPTAATASVMDADAACGRVRGSTVVADAAATDPAAPTREEVSAPIDAAGGHAAASQADLEAFAVAWLSSVAASRTA